MEIWGFEPQTLGLQSRCSSQLSYIPWQNKNGEGKKHQAACGTYTIPFRGDPLTAFSLSLRKEVIQPHLPVRLPCYDFTLLTKRTFDGASPRGLDYRLRVPPTRMV